MSQCTSDSDGFLTIGCLARGFSPADSLTFKWKDSDKKELSGFVQYPAFGRDGDYSKISHLRVRKSDWDAKKPYKCEASNSEGSKETTLVPSPKRVNKPTIALMSREDGDRIVLECQLNDYFPEKLTVQWLEGDKPVNAQINKKFQNTDKGEKKYTYISQLSISAPYEGKKYTCKANHNSEEFEEVYNTCMAQSSFKPSVQIKKAHLRDILKGSEVTISCVVEAPDNTKVSWLTDNVSKKATKEVKDQSNNIVSNLTLSRNDWLTLKTIVCTAKHPCFPEERVEIKADDIKTDPVVVIRRPFVKSTQAGSAVLECVVNDLPSGEVCINIQANDNDISDLSCVDWAPSENLWSLTTHFTIPTEHQKTGKSFTCRVHGLLKKWTSKPTGNIFGDPTIELAVVHSVGQSSSDSQKLLCSATGFDPKIKWLSNSTEKTGGALDATMMEDGRLKVYREILVPQKEWNEGVSYTCQTDDGYSGKPAKKSTSICTVIAPSSKQAEIYLLGPSHSDVRSGTSVILTCLVVGQTVRLFSIQWKVNGKLLNHDVDKQAPKEHNNGTQSRENIMRVSGTKWNNYDVFTCEVTHLCSNDRHQQNISKTRDPKRPTVRILRPSDGDLSGLQNTNLLCLITGFFPSDISVQWQLNGTQLDASQFTNSPVVAHTSGGFAMHSALMLPASEWKDGMFSCVVSHESSQSPIIDTLENLYASLIQSAPSAKLLQGVSELVCLAFGFSPPAINITWWLGKTEVSAHRVTKPAKGPDGKFSIRSHLDLQPSDWAPGEVYTCRVTHLADTLVLNISMKTALFEEAIFLNENKPEAVAQDTVEEVWNMACAFLILFLLSLLYGCTVTLVKVKLT